MNKSVSEVIDALPAGTYQIVPVSEAVNQVFTEADLASLLEHLDPGSERWMDSESIPIREGDEGYDIDTSLLVEMMNEVARIVRMEKK